MRALSAALAVLALCAPARADDAAFQTFLKAAQAQTQGASREALCLDAELFQGAEQGAVVAQLEGGARRRFRLALKLVSQRRDDGTIVDRLGVFDVTALEEERAKGGAQWCQEKVPVKFFSLDLPGQTAFNFEQSGQGSPYLTLTVSEDGSVSIASPKLSDQQLGTSRDKLLSLRAKEIESSPEMDVGTGKFLCLVQPVDPVTVAFFPAFSNHKSADLLGAVYSGDKGLLPAKIGEIGVTPYFLSYDRKTGRVVAVAGPSPETPLE